ncbi:hypothetical protein NMY22_g9340 [Coprinellus aureogranulatus]|nr:hypothetical protein NMY22_g9340 [Coprinellus aureogranulatus]
MFKLTSTAFQRFTFMFAPTRCLVPHAAVKAGSTPSLLPVCIHRVLPCAVTATLARIRYWLYWNLLTRPSHHERVRWFRFGIPLVMKRSQFPESSESGALRFLHSTGLKLPIPRVIDSFSVDGENYTIMTRLPGDSLLNLCRRGGATERKIEAVFDEVRAVVQKLWTLSPPPHQTNIVMCHPDGGGLPFFRYDYEETLGPLPIDEFYAVMTYSWANHHPWTGNDIKLLAPDLMAKVMSDRVVYVHGDLHLQNIMVTPDGKFSGIIDWENSGWHARHWQLFVLRMPFGAGNPLAVAKIWRAFRFEPELEEAYVACYELSQGKEYDSDGKEILPKYPWGAY